jgi:hypothetical protein
MRKKQLLEPSYIVEEKNCRDGADCIQHWVMAVRGNTARVFSSKHHPMVFNSVIIGPLMLIPTVYVSPFTLTKVRTTSLAVNFASPAGAATTGSGLVGKLTGNSAGETYPTRVFGSVSLTIFLVDMNCIVFHV